MKGVKAIGGKVLHIEAADQLENIAPELRGHRSETELLSPEMLTSRVGSLLHEKNGISKWHEPALDVLWQWGWR
jgi:hypothetical protein